MSALQWDRAGRAGEHLWGGLWDGWDRESAHISLWGTGAIRAVLTGNGFLMDEIPVL